MIEMETIDLHNNNCHFQYFVELGDELRPDEITFKVYSIPKEELRWFSYKLKIIDNNIAKSEMMNNNSNFEFSKKGIPEKIIEIAADHLERSVISSPINPKMGDFLVPQAIKAWERLIKQNNKVRKDEENGCYILEYNKK